MPDVVDVYDSATGAWSAERLSLAREGFAVATPGTRAVFAGGRALVEGARAAGLSDRVDIYDGAPGS